MHVQKKDFKALKDSVYRLFKVIPKSLNLKLKMHDQQRDFPDSAQRTQWSTWKTANFLS